MHGLIFQEGPLKYSLDYDLGRFRLDRKFISLDTTEELHLPLDERQSRTSGPNADGFLIGGNNSDETIAGLKTLRGLSINEIEWRARPGVYSHAGFINSHESFLDVLRADNKYVMAQGLTHAHLAIPLFYVENLLDRVVRGQIDEVKFLYRGVVYKAGVAGRYKGVQQSIFDDGVGSSLDYYVINTENGEKIQFSVMVPYYIWMYGFYEGHTDYRVEPSKIIKVFNLAMKSPEHSHIKRASVRSAKHNGGIDLNSVNLAMTIKRDGKGMPLPLAQQDMAQLNNLEGLEPVILQIRTAGESTVLSKLLQPQA